MTVVRVEDGQNWVTCFTCSRLWMDVWYAKQTFRVDSGVGVLTEATDAKSGVINFSSKIGLNK